MNSNCSIPECFVVLSPEGGSQVADGANFVKINPQTLAVDGTQ
jgi:hypothetical protein